MNFVHRAAIAGCFAVTSVPAGAAPVLPSAVPLAEQFLPNGAPIYSFPVQIGSKIVETGLDTGSLGLRVLPDTLSSLDARDSGQPVQEVYGSNVVLDGTVGFARVGVGLINRTTAIELTKSVSCKVGGCPYDRVEPKSAFRLEGMGYPDRGFRTIAGVRLPSDQPTLVPSLFASLGISRYLIDLPRRSETSTGLILLAPPQSLTRGFVKLPDARAAYGQPAIGPGQVPGCLVGSGMRICGVVLFDTGAPGIRVFTRQAVTPWSPHTAASLQLTDGPAQNVLATESFVTGTTYETAVRFETFAPGAYDRPQIKVGVLPYLGFSILYDAARPGIAVRPRSPAPGGPIGSVD